MPSNDCLSLSFENNDGLIKAQNEAQERDPFENAFGLHTNDGVGNWAFGCFTNQREVIEFIAVVESYVLHSDSKEEYEAIRSQILNLAVNSAWQLSDALCESINELFGSAHCIAWWGNISTEIELGASGYFGSILEDIASESRISVTEMLKRGMNSAERIAFVESLRP